jgi:hypothetical protein
LDLAHFWAAFFITDIVVQNLPDQPANPMRDGPDGLLVFQAHLQTAKHYFEYASFHFYRGVGSLIQNAPHGAVALR